MKVKLYMLQKIMMVKVKEVKINEKFRNNKR